MELDPAKLQEMIAAGEAQLDELRSGAPVSGDADLRERVARLEDRLDQQEAVLRHALTMLIEWFEAESAPESGES